MVSHRNYCISPRPCSCFFQSYAPILKPSRITSIRLKSFRWIFQSLPLADWMTRACARNTWKAGLCTRAQSFIRNTIQAIIFSFTQPEKWLSLPWLPRYDPFMKKTDPQSWSVPLPTLDLQLHQVDVWRASLRLPVNVLNKLENTLSEDERERAAQFHFPADRDRFIAAHGCLRDVLGRYLHCRPDEFTFSANQYGKPALCNRQLEFNLSHSGDFALIAITRDRRVGIDVERIRWGISSQAISR